MNYAEFASKWKFDPAYFGESLVDYSIATCKGMHGACYLITDDEGFLSYVGKASCRGVIGRVRSHEEKRWFARAMVLETRESSMFSSADVVEVALIRVFQPYANRQRYLGQGKSAGTDVWVLERLGIMAPFHTDEQPFSELIDTRAAAAFPKPQPGEPKGAFHARLRDAMYGASLGRAA